MTSFERNLEAGNVGERMVERFLQENRQWYTIPSYDFNGDDKAPRMRCMGDGLVIPDLDCARAGTRRWVEVKTYDHAAFNRAMKCLVHGIKRRLYYDYVQVEINSGAPVFLCVLEVSTGDLLCQHLRSMEAFPCMCPACKREEYDRCQAWSMRDCVYFKREHFEHWHTFSSEEMEPVRVAFEDRKPQMVMK